MKLTSILISLCAITLLTSACSSNTGSYQASANNSAWKSTVTSKGKIYTDKVGRAIYTFDKDSKSMSNCYGACAKAWPPFTAASNSKNTGNWSVINRKDGSKQWAINGKPLYYFAADTSAGDVKGDGVNNVWHLVSASSAKTKKVKAKPAVYESSNY